MIKGKALVLWVAERITKEVPELPLIFAVDHVLLQTVLQGAGYRTLLTSAAHQSGTDRIAEANRTIKADTVINVQADEPLVTGNQIRKLAELITGTADMATLCAPFKTTEDFANPNQVKVVMRNDGRALYFSRSPMPYARDSGGKVDDAWVGSQPCYRHLGLYAYKAELLERFARLPLGRYERIEKLEQLRVLENGYEIALGVTEDPTIGVDTAEDAAKFEAVLGKQT
jgi:3-deoxy-manno-octulosonate cytidylyltransferase (CMP-KDO synthetase)